jgi:hypothetical protein
MLRVYVVLHQVATSLFALIDARADIKGKEGKEEQDQYIKNQSSFSRVCH